MATWFHRHRIVGTLIVTVLGLSLKAFFYFIT